MNEDRGGKIKDRNVNIGESVTESLMESDALGWTFFDTRQKGLEEVNKGNVYATIIIPSDFSEKIVTLVDKESVKPELEYYVNEKINAIAPKITDKGASTIQTQISTAFTTTVADEVIDVMHKIGVELGVKYPSIEKLRDLMEKLSDKFPELEERLEALSEAAKDGKGVIDRKDKNVVAV